jgi:hypothetical protein
MTGTRAEGIKRGFLYSLVVSVALSALLGAIAILSDELGSLQVRVLLTTATVSLASLFGLACGAYLATGRGQLIPRLGIVLTLLGCTTIVAGIWIDPHEDAYWKLTLSISVFAVAFGHLSLLSMARLSQAFRWSLIVAHVVILCVAALVVVMILGEIDTDGMLRLLGVAAIVDGAITILIPIFHRLSKREESGRGAVVGSETDPIDQEIAQLKARIVELERQQRQRG